MSRSGRIPIKIPDNTEVKLDKGVITAKGKLGELSYNFGNSANVELNTNTVMVSNNGNNKHNMRMWGTVRSRISNIIEGVSSGFIKELELNGVGYKASAKGKSVIRKMIKGEKCDFDSSSLSKREWNELMESFGFKEKIL